jgi:hypothetical protein
MNIAEFIDWSLLQSRYLHIGTAAENADTRCVAITTTNDSHQSSSLNVLIVVALVASFIMAIDIVISKIYKMKYLIHQVLVMR